MNDKNKSQNVYDDDNIPEIDLPRQNRNFQQVTSSNAAYKSAYSEHQPGETWQVEPLPEATRPRKDGPGGDGND